MLAAAARSMASKRDAWGSWLSSRPADDRTVLWGSGSRAVGFLGAVPGSGRVSGVVDINPHRSGRYMPGFAHPILSPAALARRGCDTVVIMNPVYHDEIAGMLGGLGIRARVLTVDQPPDP